MFRRTNQGMTLERSRRSSHVVFEDFAELGTAENKNIYPHQPTNNLGRDIDEEVENLGV